MMYKICLLFVTLLIVSGCSTSDLQNSIDDAINKDKEQISTIDKETDEQDGLDRHNEIRAKVYNGSALSWSDEIAKDAQSHANTLANSGEFKHDPKNYNGYDNGPYGENLYATTDNSNIAFRDAINNWYVEKKYYNYSDNSCSVNSSNPIIEGLTQYNTCGHYTQIIWKDTQYVGCAKAKYKAGDLKGGYVIVCKYKSPGNVIQNGVPQRPY